MKVATFNVNSIRQRLEIVLDWMYEHEPDVLALQETKVEDQLFPLDAFTEAGFHVAIHGQKARNGVALISRSPIQSVSFGFGDPLFPDDCRLMVASVDCLHVINTYVPNGTEIGSEAFAYKLSWLKRFGSLVQSRFSPTDNVVWMGDVNIAPTPDDVYNPKKYLGQIGHHPDEFAALDAVRSWGWVDCFRKFTSGPGHYSFFDYVLVTSVAKNFGWRIDHIYASPALAEKCVTCEIDKAPRLLPKPSDHTPVWAEFDLS